MNSQLLKQQMANKTHNNFYVHDVPVSIKDPIPNNIKMTNVIYKLEKILSRQFMNNVDIVYIGNFEELTARSVQAMFEDGAVYITNALIDQQDLIDNFVHEVGHAVLQYYSNDIFGDRELEEEFENKRIKLHSLLKQEGYDVKLGDFLNMEYSELLDQILFEDIGYEKLRMLTVGLFVSPYAATSLKEYFANGFEHYILGRRHTVCDISKVLCSKIDNIYDS